MSVVISPEEQIRRVARALLALSAEERRTGSWRGEPDLIGLIGMIDRHLQGDLPPIEVPADRAPPRRDSASGR
ncbi:hypothetical protein [Tautonia sociabilis]|uniref:Uncharacterized protein n=1 Tax=Tautonia sociabilis TaxID=2080755 RepID=A0A432MG96_9BACT|nr:hypothetical protein [Tautonia sociabilis]RUL85606.1 hypothetical protein TsocGM_18005 [Tautonia sociabilis]